MTMRIAQRYFRLLYPGFEACFAVEALGRWVRLGLFYGDAPGSHMMGKHFAWWLTRAYGMRGWNVRFGWWPKPCATILLHTRRAAPIWSDHGDYPGAVAP
jgi:hypothetical protein